MGKFFRGCLMVVGGIVVLIVVIAVIGAIANGSHSTTNDTTGTSNPAVQTNNNSGGNSSSSQPATHTVLVNHQGSGQWTSPTFTGPSNWTILYAYNCSNFGQAGNFQVTVEGGNPGFSTSGVNELKLKGSGSTSVHDASGAGVYLQVNSECDWHIKAVS